MARIEGLSARPGLEAPVAAAGPCANLALAAGLACFSTPWLHAGVVLNLVLGLGNLLPLYPLDGGRILRAWLARRSPLPDATRAAIPPGWLLLALLVALGMTVHSVWVPLLLGLYLFSSAWTDLLKVMILHGPPRHTRAQVWMRSFRAAATDGYADSPLAAGAEPAASDLENFRGSLDEFFRDRTR